jgi:hypothetical protein
MSDPDPWPAMVPSLLRAARALHEGHAGATEASWEGVAFTVLRRGARNTVVRATVTASPGQARSVVLKLLGEDHELAAADWRCMKALSGTGVVPDVVMRLPDVHGFAMVDAGDETLARVLERDTAGDALRAVASMAVAYARLHVAGRTVVTRDGAARFPAGRDEAVRWRDGIGRALSWLHLTGDDPSLPHAVERVLRVVTAGDAATLTQGDPAPGNVFLTPHRPARLVDFEYGAVRHAAHDLAAWDVICPLPNEAVQALRSGYADARERSGWPLGPGEDDASYAAVCTHRALALLSWLPAAARHGDVPWVASWTARQAVLSTLDRLAERARDDVALHWLADAAQQAAVHWRRAWPDVRDVLPPWPAFRDRNA